MTEEHEQAEIVAALNRVGTSAGPPLRQELAESNPPAYLLESAEGLSTYPGLNGDEQSKAVRDRAEERFAEMRERYPDTDPHHEQ